MTEAIGFTFDDIHSSAKNIRSIENVRRSLLPPTVPITIRVPGRPGEYYSTHQFWQRVIEFDALLYENTREGLRQTVRQIADWLNPGRGVKKLILDDEPGLYYNAVLSHDTDIEQQVSLGRVTLTFICPDPIALTVDEIETNFSGGVASVNVGGTYQTFPRFQVEFLEKSTFLLITKSEKEFLFLGLPEDVDSERKPAVRRVYTDDCSSLTGWEEGIAVDGGLIKGSMGVGDPPKFIVTDYGTWEENDPSWHGPAMVRWLPDYEELQDFRVRMHLYQATPGIVGRVELYLLDVNEAIIGKVALKDIRTSVHKNEPEARAGPLSTGVYFHSTEHHALNDFYGVLEIERVGTTWKFFVARRQADGSYTHRRTTYFYDREEKFMQKLAAIQIHMATMQNKTPLDHYIRYITVSEINETEQIVGDGQIPEIFDVGDVLDIDCSKGIVLLNSERYDGYDLGDLFMWPLDPMSTFFGLESGMHTLHCFASGNVTAKAFHRERWL